MSDTLDDLQRDIKDYFAKKLRRGRHIRGVKAVMEKELLAIVRLREQMLESSPSTGQRVVGRVEDAKAGISLLKILNSTSNSNRYFILDFFVINADYLDQAEEIEKWALADAIEWAKKVAGLGFIARLIPSKERELILAYEAQGFDRTHTGREPMSAGGDRLTGLILRPRTKS